MTFAPRRSGFIPIKPVSENKMFTGTQHGHRHVHTPVYRKALADIKRYVNRTWKHLAVKQEKLPNCGIEITVYLKSYTVSDAGNYQKGIKDALEGVVYENDRQLKWVKETKEKADDRGEGFEFTLFSHTEKKPTAYRQGQQDTERVIDVIVSRKEPAPQPPQDKYAVLEQYRKESNHKNITSMDELKREIQKGTLR